MFMKRRFLFTADVHGNLFQYEELVKYALEKEFQTIVVGGDISFKHHKIYFNRPADEECKMKKSPKVRRKIFMEYIYPIFKEFLEKDESNLIILCYGNADFHRNLEFYRNIHPQMIVLTNDIYDLTPKFEMLVYSSVNLIPYRLKDNERFEFEEHEKYDEESYRIGYTSWPEEKIKEYGFEIQDKKVKALEEFGEIIPIKLKDNPKFSIEYEMGNLIKNSNKKKHQIWLTHAPPYGCNDLTSSGNRVGSKMIRKFIEKHQPVATFSGHIHESYFLTGKYIEMIGNTRCVCAGNSPSSTILRVIEVEIDGDQLKVIESVGISYSEKVKNMKTVIKKGGGEKKMKKKI